MPANLINGGHGPLLQFAPIDWTRPWHAAIRDAAETVSACAEWTTVVNQHCVAKAIINHRGLPLSFVEQTSLPEDMAYEAFISATGNVPTRDNLHDFFNALVWLSFPHIKRQLNALQAEQIARDGIGKSRGPARDAATIFDENAALLVARDDAQGSALVAALRDHQWMDVLFEQRSDFKQHVEVWLFGHALLEKLATPYKAITAHAWIVMADDEYFAKPFDMKRKWLDEQVAADLQARGLSDLNTAGFTPLPVLGVPDWWQPQDRAFYADASVFRPKAKS